MAGYPWHYFETNYVVGIIIILVSIITFNLARQYYGGVDAKNAAIDPEDSSDTKKEEIIIEDYFLFNTVGDLKKFLKNKRHEMDLAAEKAFAAHGIKITAKEIKNQRESKSNTMYKCKFSNIC